MSVRTLRPISLLRLSLLVPVAMIAAVLSLRADIKLDEQTRRVPTAKDVTVKVYRGIPATIVLEGVTGSGRALDFRIRRQPQVGQLQGAPQPVSKLQSSVRYLAPAGSSGKYDSFTYVTQAASATSSEATVSIEIQEPKPDLRIPAVLEAGQVTIGRAVEREIYIRNDGNAPWTARVDVPEGWAWASPARGEFHIEPGGQTVAVLIINPQAQGPIRREIAFGENRVLRVTGSALPPFTAFPGFIRLRWDPVTRTRTGRLEIQNSTEQAIHPTLTAPDGIAIPGEISISPRETASIPFALTTRVDISAEGIILIKVPGYAQEIRYDAPLAPAWLEIPELTGQDTVEFGSLDSSTLPLAVRELTLRNVGGESTKVTAVAPKLFLTPGFEPDTRLRPGEEMRFRVLPRQDVSGNLEERWTIEYGASSRELTLRASIASEAATQALASRPPLLPSNQSSSAPGAGAGREPPPVSSPEHITQLRLHHDGLLLSPANGKVDPSLPRIDSVKMVDEDPFSLTFDIRPPGEGRWKYTLLRARVQPVPEQDGSLMTVTKVWTPWKKVEFRDVGDVTRVKVTGLVPGELVPIRIQATREADGVSTEAGRELRFLTKDKLPRPWGWIALWTFLGISAALWVRQKWREDIAWSR